jgi:hypothetical protein
MIVALLLAAATPVEPVPDRTPGPTTAEARTQAPAELARRVLGPSGEIYREVQRPGPGGGLVAVSWLSGLMFATAPHSSGFPGLCEAETLFVGFRPAAGTPRQAADAPVYVDRLTSGKAYKIVGDATASSDGGSDDDERGLAARCATVGPVLWQPDTRAKVSHFFSVRFDGNSSAPAAMASFGARALQKAMVASQSLSQIPCREDHSEPAAHLCADPHRLLNELPMERLVELRIAPCSLSASALCVVAAFIRQSDELEEQRFLDVRIETNASIVDPPHDFEIVGVTIEGHTIAF